MCLRDDAFLRLACLREVSSPAHASSRRRVSSPELSSGSVFARPCVFATTPVFPRPVFGKCLGDDTCLRDDACLRLTCLREVSSPSHVSSRRRLSLPDLSLRRVFARPYVFATTRAFARPVFGKCLLARSWLHFWTCLGKDSALGKCVREDTCLRDDTSSDTCLRRECVFRRPRVFAVFAWHLSADAYVSSQTVR